MSISSRANMQVQETYYLHWRYILFTNHGLDVNKLFISAIRSGHVNALILGSWNMILCGNDSIENMHYMYSLTVDLTNIIYKPGTEAIILIFLNSSFEFSHFFYTEL